MFILVGQVYHKLNIIIVFIELNHFIAHALVALGVSIFEKIKESNNYKVHNFNFTLVSTSPFKICPSSSRFLVENGYDFNQQFKSGIHYIAGDYIEPIKKKKIQQLDLEIINCNNAMRNIFSRIITSKAPVVTHNGFLDLIFLYHSFHASLPSSFSCFIADLTEMFSGYMIYYCNLNFLFFLVGYMIQNTLQNM